MSNNSYFIKTDWKDVCEKVREVEPKLACIIDELSPDSSLPLFLASYPYGAVIADTISTYIPNNAGELTRLNDASVSTDIYKHLKYAESLPMGLVIDKKIEYSIDLPSANLTLPWLVYEPGSIFPFSTILSYQNRKSYSPNGMLIATAGVKSTFMLPNISCATNHMYLQRDYSVQSSVPKSLREHWIIFKEILNKNKDQWLCKILFFSEAWIKKIHTDKAWLLLKAYLLELGWERFEYEKNRVYYDITFSMIQKNKNLKPNPYLTDTARHLFSIANGIAPGFIPATDEEALPLKRLQTAFVESYNLKKYAPIIMQAASFKTSGENNQTIYYSLQHPCTHVFSPKSRKVSSTIYEMRELEHIMRVFQNELSKKDNICSDTILGETSDKIIFKYFHNEIDPHKIINHSTMIKQMDKTFFFKEENNHLFPEDAKFFRGCISISKKI